MSVLLIDNYDSFTHNLAQALTILGAEVIVHRNDALGVAEAEALHPTHLVISPGPGRPADAGTSVSMIQTFLGHIPILGVCLGHQSLAFALGGQIRSARQLLHGEPSQIQHSGDGLFAGLRDGFTAGRYHSLAVDEPSLPSTLTVTARSDDGEVMALQHRSALAFGVQFHPESILTPEGPTLLRNFLRLGGVA
ncbi:MAG: anthranilate synthase/aminodeoxychorismate synthase-like glutamine amidotransferase [Myxococcota bacterium]|jgi:anthranilate synthase/aminodeoxychorismate synthase-like glutamine amidotransferase